jgi:hypothetical protein
LDNVSNIKYKRKCPRGILERRLENVTKRRGEYESGVWEVIDCGYCAICKLEMSVVRKIIGDIWFRIRNKV